MYMIVMSFIIGAVWGSFLDCYFSRKLAGDTNLSGRSRCDSCGKTLRWFELLPIVSYLLAGGVCRKCKAKIPWRIFLSEVYAGLMGASTWMAISEGSYCLAAMFVLLLVDGIHDTISGETSYISMLILIIVSVFTIYTTQAITVALVWLVLLVLAAAVLGQAMGHADIVYFAACSALVSFQFAIAVIFISALLALLVVLGYKHILHKSIQGVRLIPYIGLACMAAIALQPLIESWWSLGRC